MYYGHFSLIVEPTRRYRWISATSCWRVVDNLLIEVDGRK
jgi:hypothetical protein